jgi:hypothetical protein
MARFGVCSHCHEFQSAWIQLGRALGEFENFHGDDALSFVVVQHDTWRDFFRLDGFRIVELRIQGIGFLVHVQFQSLPFITRSKYTLTTRSGKPLY